ncbi:structural maintenance of chromosomes protein 2-like isoform X1 [Anthonomus grandis grandis]|uniref:structural maintenance of chromosomes protein 2-like isoform X1 n=2 Tax=Anthonomus grandis grandis TaxID=2921223 RepID=UPI00216651A9|nr:structural maintenance of chromosomes protein 2-like isoform X1 [Anthonomus grandis grandis]XP_050314592.1 structural maintenance of chromosomes protein 2-like isoform X1 [Anthonomus grandis grandis]
MPNYEQIVYKGDHVIPIYQRNGLLEERNLNINIFDFGDKLQIKLRDLSEYSFNFTDYVDLGDFEVMRVNQCLDINYSEFKTNIVEMLYQFQKKELFLKCELSEKSCTLVFFTKSKIKSIVYLTLELKPTDHKEIISEMYLEINELQEVNNRLQKQLSTSRKLVQEKEADLKDLEVAKKAEVEQFCKSLEHIEKFFNSKSSSIYNHLIGKISIFNKQISGLQIKIKVLKEENNLKVDSSDRLIRTMENLRVENMESNQTINDLKKENSTLNILRVKLEKNVADLQKNLETLQIANRNMENKKTELEKDLEKLSIIVTQKDSKISELSKDLVQANNMLVQFNGHFDIKQQQVDELQDDLSKKEKFIIEQKCKMNQILQSFQDYKSKFNKENLDNMRRDLLSANKRIHDMEEEIKKLNKINALLSQKMSQGGYLNNRK